VPIELKLTSKTSSVCPVNVCITYPEPTSQILHVLSIEPVAAYSPVNSNYTDEISASWSFNIRMHSPVYTSHILAVLSKDAVINLSPSEEKCNATISPS